MSSSSSSSSTATAANDFLDRKQVAFFLEDALTLLAERRPANPIEFLAHYFREQSAALHDDDGEDLLDEEDDDAPTSATAVTVRLLRHSQPARRAFFDDLVLSYSLLTRASPVGGLTRAQCRRIVRDLCADFPVAVTDRVFGVLLPGAASSEAEEEEAEGGGGTVPFEQFCQGMEACLLYREFFERAEWLFKQNDTDGVGTLDRDSLVRVLEQLRAEAASDKSGLQVPEPQLIQSILDSAGMSSSLSVCRISYKAFVRALFALMRPAPIES